MGWEAGRLGGWMAGEVDHRYKEEGKTGLMLLTPHTKISVLLVYEKRNRNKLPIPCSFQDCFSIK